MTRWAKDAEFTVAVTHNAQNASSASYIPKPVLRRLGNPQSIKFTIRDDCISGQTRRLTLRVKLGAWATGMTGSAVDKLTNWVKAKWSQICKRTRGFNSENPALLFLFITHYNFVRPHMGLTGKTPTEAMGIRVDGDDKWATLLAFASAC